MPRGLRVKRDPRLGPRRLARRGRGSKRAGLVAAHVRLFLFFFVNISGHTDGERRGAVLDLNAPEGTSRRDLSDATLRFDLAPGVRRRRSPKSC